MRLSSYLQSALEILLQYKGDVPFAAWLKNYFRQHKKFGSKDRKLVADLCFCYFRLGAAFHDQTVEERLLTGQFLCHSQSLFVQELKPAWKEMNTCSPEEKLAFLSPDQSPSLFPFPEEVSNEIDLSSFQLSFLQQPDLFLRIRPGKEKTVLQKLEKAGVVYTREEDSLRLSNSTKIEEILAIDREVVVQDRSSQRVLEPLQLQAPNTKSPTSLWDCCAASGGKSILAYDRLHPVQLTVSDIRESVLINLKNRFERAGIKNYRSFVADLSQSKLQSNRSSFDLIICDAPCSGSGTWARTPEQLSFFRSEKIASYTALQKSIAQRASQQLKKGGYFLYITCSVFQKENEDVVAFLKGNTGLQLLSQTYFKGYQQRADTLFAALFTV